MILHYRARLFQMARSDELAMELLNLLNARAALREQSSSRRYQDEANALAKEEERIRAVVRRLSNKNLVRLTR